MMTEEGMPLGPWENTLAEMRILREEVKRLREVISWARIYGQMASGGVDHDDWEDELKRRENAALKGGRDDDGK